MRRRLSGPVACALLFAGCQAGPLPGPSPSSSPTPPTTPSPSPAPQPLQRMEASLPAPVEEAAAAAAGGRLFVMGGFNAVGASLATVYVFDGSAWSVGPRVPLPLDHPSAATLDDRVYLAGGHSNGRDSTRLFRLDGDRWTELAPMHFARGGHALIAVQARLYAIGGNTIAGNVGPVEQYDPDANTWATVATLPQPRNHVLGFAGGFDACVGGGRSPNTARVDCFDPISHRWSQAPNLPVPTSGGGASTFEDGDVIVAGGEDATENRLVDLFAVFTTQGWAGAGRMLVPRHGFELAMFNGRAWACGGGSAPGLHPVTTCTSLGDPASS